MSIDKALFCEHVIVKGPRAGGPCRYRATMVVVAPIGIGEFVCGIHARAWQPKGLARLAYYDPKGKAWW